jgi:hypothetical protein
MTRHDAPQSRPQPRRAAPTQPGWSNFANVTLTTMRRSKVHSQFHSHKQLQSVLFSDFYYSDFHKNARKY